MKRALDHDVVEAVLSFVKKLSDESSNGALVAVEGRRDVSALRALGFAGSLFTLSHNGSLVGLVEEAERHRKTILLFDLDEKGRSLTKKSATILEEKKCTVDLFFRRMLASATKGRVRHVEELAAFKEYTQEYL